MALPSDSESRASASELTDRPASPANAPRGERDRRRHRRFDVSLPGRYLLEDGQEYPCECIDVSAGGFRLRGPKPGQWGSRVIAYIDSIGRVEGWVVRRAPGWFAIETRPSLRKEERVVGRIAGLVDDRQGGRRRSMAPKVTLETQDGRRYLATLADLSLEGASLIVEADIGELAPVWLNERSAHVVQVFPGGLELAFDVEPPRAGRA